MPWSFFFHGRDADGGLREEWKRGCEIMLVYYFTANFLHYSEKIVILESANIFFREAQTF